MVFTVIFIVIYCWQRVTGRQCIAANARNIISYGGDPSLFSLSKCHYTKGRLLQQKFARSSSILVWTFPYLLLFSSPTHKHKPDLAFDVIPLPNLHFYYFINIHYYIIYKRLRSREDQGMSSI